RRDAERFIHRHQKVPRAVDAAPRAERLRHDFSEGDADVLDRVMLIDIEVARRVEGQIERAVAREELQHMVKKTDARANSITPSPVEDQRHANARLRRLSIDYGAAHKTSSMTVRKRWVCSTRPVPTRTHPAQPGSFERSRI